MKSAEDGSTVKVHYTGKLDNGTVFDSSREREPLEFTLGKGQLIKGFENAVVGMKIGDTKTVNVSSTEAYGDRKDELVIKVEKAQVPDNIEPKVGLALNLRTASGGQAQAVITSIEEEHITLDANHPLAGQDLTFELELMEIV